jgi:hypothetical protein
MVLSSTSLDQYTIRELHWLLSININTTKKVYIFFWLFCPLFQAVSCHLCSYLEISWYLYVLVSAAKTSTIWTGSMIFPTVYSFVKFCSLYQQQVWSMECPLHELILFSYTSFPFTQNKLLFLLPLFGVMFTFLQTGLHIEANSWTHTFQPSLFFWNLVICLKYHKLSQPRRPQLNNHCSKNLETYICSWWNSLIRHVVCYHLADRHFKYLNHTADRRF